MSNVHFFNILEKPEALPVMTGSWKCHQKILRSRISRKNILVRHYMALISIFYWITIFFTSKPVSLRKNRLYQFFTINFEIFLHHQKEQLKLYKMSRTRWCYDCFLKNSVKLSKNLSLEIIKWVITHDRSIRIT